MRFLVSLLLIMPSLLLAQPKKGDNLILIKGKVDMNDFARFLVLNDYEIDNNDEKLMYLTTQHIQIKKRSGSTFRIKAVFSSDSVELLGLVQLSTFDKSQRNAKKFVEERARFTIMPSYYRSSFEQILDLAKKYASDKKVEVKTIEK